MRRLFPLLLLLSCSTERPDGDIQVATAGLVALPPLGLQYFGGLPSNNCTGPSAACSASSMAVTGALTAGTATSSTYTASGSLYVCSGTGQCLVAASADDTTMTGVVPGFEVVLQTSPSANDRLACISHGSVGSQTRVACWDKEGDGSQTSVVLSTAANPVQVVQDGEICLNQPTCDKAIVYNSSNGSIDFAGGFRFINSGSMAGNLTMSGNDIQMGTGSDVNFTGATGEVNLNTTVIGTAGSGTGYTTANSATVREFVHKITVAETALTGAATTEDETIWTIPAKTKVTRMIAQVTATFTGGTISDFDVTCGITAGGNEYLVSFDIDTATGVFGDAEAELGTGLAGGIGNIPSFSGTTAVQCRFTSVGDNVVNATAGSVTFYIEGVVYP